MVIMKHMGLKRLLAALVYVFVAFPQTTLAQLPPSPPPPHPPPTSSGVMANPYVPGYVAKGGSGQVCGSVLSHSPAGGDRRRLLSDMVISQTTGTLQQCAAQCTAMATGSAQAGLPPPPASQGGGGGDGGDRRRLLQSDSCAGFSFTANATSSANPPPPPWTTSSGGGGDGGDRRRHLLESALVGDCYLLSEEPTNAVSAPAHSQAACYAKVTQSTAMPPSPPPPTSSGVMTNPYVPGYDAKGGSGQECGSVGSHSTAPLDERRRLLSHVVMRQYTATLEQCAAQCTAMATGSAQAGLPPPPAPQGGGYVDNSRRLLESGSCAGFSFTANASASSANPPPPPGTTPSGAEDNSRRHLLQSALVGDCYLLSEEPTNAVSAPAHSQAACYAKESAGFAMPPSPPPPSPRQRPPPPPLDANPPITDYVEKGEAGEVCSHPIPDGVMADRRRLLSDNVLTTKPGTTLEQCAYHCTSYIWYEAPTAFDDAPSSEDYQGGRRLLESMSCNGFSWGVPDPTVSPTTSPTPSPTTDQPVDSQPVDNDRRRQLLQTSALVGDCMLLSSVPETGSKSYKYNAEAACYARVWPSPPLPTSSPTSSPTTSSPTASAPPPYVLVPTVESTIAFADMDLDALPENFNDTFKADLAKAAGVAPADVEILSIASGSVVVISRVSFPATGTTATNATAAAEDFTTKLKADPSTVFSSELADLAGDITVSADTIMMAVYTPSPPPSLPPPTVTLTRASSAGVVPAPADNGSPDTAPAIAGGVIGGAAFLLLIAGVVYFKVFGKPSGDPSGDSPPEIVIAENKA